jgi:SPP1 gp7 family putative phage head morphogenesis protein
MADGDPPQQPFQPKPGEPYAEGQPTANEQLLNSAIYHGLSLERVSAGMAQDIKDLLVKAQEDITGKLQSGTLTDWQTKRAQQFLEWSNKTIANAYNKIDGNVADTLDGIKVAEIAKQTNSINQALGVEISPAMSTQQLESIAKADELLVNGAVMSDWWKKQASNLQHQVKTTVQQGLTQGKSTQDIAKDLRQFLPTDEDISQKQAVAQANALARTAAATVQSEAQQAYYKENSDILKGIQWVSTLDSRTTPQCQALDGNAWTYSEDGEMSPVGHDIPFPGFPPIHWNCRSTTVPVLKSWQELSDKELPHLDDATVQEAFESNLADQGFTPDQIADISMNQRASVDGTVPESTTYEDWLGKQPELTQKQILGPAKWQLWHDGAVTLKDMINKQTLEPLTVDELIAAAKQNKAVPAPPPPVEGKYGLSLAENQILTAQMTSGATAGEQWASWYNPENGVRIDQALKSSITQDENAQLQAQNKLVHLTNSLSNTQFWNKSDASLWAGQPGFQSAKLTTPSGRVITAKLKPGATWTLKDVGKYSTTLADARESGLDEYDAQNRAFRATGKMILTQTEPGALSLDSSTMKKVYGPVHAEDKPLSFLEAHANQEQLQKDAELSAKMADIKDQLKAADQAQQDYAEQSQLAREKQAELQTLIAQRDLEAATQAKKEADDLVATHQAQVADAKMAADEALANQATAQKAAQRAQDALAAHEKAAQEAKELEAKQAAEKAALEAWEKAQEQAKIAASEQARADTALRNLDKANDALQAHIADQKNAADLQAAHDAEVAAKKAQEKEIKKQKAAAKKAAKLAKAAAAAVNTHGQMDLALEPKAELKTNFPADPMALKVVKELGGYTHAQLVEDADGNLWVRKRGANPEHIASEALFDHLYGIAGVDVPESKLYSTPSGNVKLARYIPDTTILGDYLKASGPAEKDRILGVVKNQFVANALFANWDAVGANPAAGFDNILIGKNGKAYMIDTGGAGVYKGTGIKAAGKFGPQVGELQTMLDPRVNPTTAPIFKGITDQQVVDQSVKIFQVRNQLLGATPAPLKAMLAARLDYLDNYVTELVASGKAAMPDLAPPELKQHVAAAPKPPSWAGEPDMLKAITDSKVTGMSIWSDKGAVEDANTLAWTEKNAAGQRETVAQVKLTDSAMKELEDFLKPYLPAMPSAYSSAAPQAMQGLASDKFYDKILGGVKTVNFHANDAGYNQAKVADALAQKQPLGQLLMTGTVEEKKMALTYLKTIKDLEDSIALKPTGKLTSIGAFNKYQPPPPAAPTAPVIPTPVPQLTASRDKLNVIEKNLTAAGEATHLNSSAFVSNNTDTILIDLGDVKARYIPNSSNNESYAFALKGQLELRTTGEATGDVMQKLQAGFKQLGIDVTPPTDEYKKSMYLTKNIYFLNGSKLPLEVEQAIKDVAMSDAERLAKIEEIAKRDFKISIKPNDLRWQGQMPATGDGYRYFLRADMTEQKLATDLQGYRLKHYSSASMPKLIEAFMESGGEITPTTERLRKGISLARTGGMSSTTDLTTGGGSYFFTRITDAKYASGNHLYWGPETLARLDAYSYRGDEFGNVKNANTKASRATTIAKYKSYSNSGSNETILKNGSTVLDLQYIGVNNANERDEVIKTLRKHGITQWPDGRSLDKVVLVSGSYFPTP